MVLEPRERIVIPDEDGEEHLFETLVTFDLQELGHSYIAVVPVEQVDEEEVEVYAFRYEVSEVDQNDLALFPIDSDEEWSVVEETLATLADDGQLD